MADISKIKLPDNNEYDIKDTVARAHYCVCSTAAGTAAKTADLPGFVLETGAWVIVRFTNTNTAGVGSITLSINNTTAAAIKYKNASLIEKGALSANKTVTFVYDGTYWQIVGDVDQPLVQYGFGYTTCSTATATTAKTASLSNYLLITNSIVVVRFENDVNAGATLNINSKGAKAIYYQNAAITDGVIKAGDTVTFVYSTYYRIISIDRAPNFYQSSVSSSSTATALVAPVPGITSLKDGTMLFLTNDQLNTEAVYTLNINSLGAVPVYPISEPGQDAVEKFLIGTRKVFIYENSVWYSITPNNSGYADQIINTAGIDLNYVGDTAATPTKCYPGTYRCWDTTIATSLLNCPVTTTFRLEVKETANSARVVQILYPNDDSERFYVRTKYVSGWTSWRYYMPDECLPELVDNGAKNVLQYDGLSSKSGDCTFTFNADGSITVNGTTSSSATSYIYLNLNKANVNVANFCNGNYVLSGCPTNSSGLSLQVRGTDYTKSETGEGIVLSPYSGSGIARVTLMVAKNSTIDNLTVRPMICTKAQWDISHTYQPYAFSNPKLTVTSKELTDNGAKNILHFNSIGGSAGYVSRGGSIIRNGVTYTFNNDGTVIANGTAGTGGSNCHLLLDGHFMHFEGYCNNNYYLWGAPTNAMLRARADALTDYSISQSGDSPSLLTSTSYTGSIYVEIVISAGTAASNLVIRPMICSKHQWDISNAYVLPAESNAVLTKHMDLSDQTLTRILGTSDYAEEFKNVLQFDNIGSTTASGTTYTTNGVTFTINPDMSISVTRTSGTSNAICSLRLGNNSSYITDYCNGSYILSGCPAGGSSTKWRMCTLASGSSTVLDADTGSGVTLPSRTGDIYISLRVGADFTTSSGTIVFKPMICNAAIYTASNTYKPYLPTYRELYQIVMNISKAISNT